MTNADNAAGQPAGSPGYGEQNYPGYGQQEGWSQQQDGWRQQGQRPQQSAYPQQPVYTQKQVYPQQGQGYLGYAQQNAYGYQGYGQQPDGGLPGQPAAASEKPMLVAALLAFFLGQIGLHNFYLGQTKLGVVKIVAYPLASMVLLVSFLFSDAMVADHEAGAYVSAGSLYLVAVTMLLSLAVCAGVHVWAFVEFILILMRKGCYGVDAQGRPLS